MTDAQLTYNALTLPAKVLNLLPIRVILRKDADGRYQGVTEESFSMGLSPNRINIFWSKKGATSNLGGSFDLDAIKWAEGNVKPGDELIDPMSADCPIEIDWEDWIQATTKYNSRNAKFKFKEKSC